MQPHSFQIPHPEAHHQAFQQNVSAVPGVQITRAVVTPKDGDGLQYQVDLSGEQLNVQILVNPHNVPADQLESRIKAEMQKHRP